MVDRIEQNPKRPETKVPDQLAKAWLLAHGYEREVMEAEAEEAMKELNPIKKEVLKK